VHPGQRSFRLSSTTLAQSLNQSISKLVKLVNTYNQKGKVRKCSFQSKLKNPRRDHSRSTHTDLKILQWKAGRLSHNKETELHLNLVKHDVDIFASWKQTSRMRNSSITSSTGTHSTVYQNTDQRHINCGMELPLCGIQNSKRNG